MDAKDLIKISLMNGLDINVFQKVILLAMYQIGTEIQSCG